MIATTTIIKIIALQNPALNIPSTSSQLLSEVIKRNNVEYNVIFFIR